MTLALLAISVLLACAPTGGTGATIPLEAPPLEENESPAEADPQAIENEAAEPAASEASVPIFTLEDVALHNTETDCWLVVNGMVLDVTGFIASHPGERAILNGCGKDATALFEGVSNHVGRAFGLLSSYQIGTLAE